MEHPQKLCVFKEALWNLKHTAVPLNKPASALPPASYTPGYSLIAAQRQWVTAWVYTAVTKITPTHSQRHPPVTAFIFQCWRSDIWRHTFDWWASALCIFNRIIRLSCRNIWQLALEALVSRCLPPFLSTQIKLNEVKQTKGLFFKKVENT